MRFLADEDVYAITINRIRAAGWDAVAVADTPLRGQDDGVVWRWAIVQSRILASRDKDFGRRFVSSPEAPPGVVLIRGPFHLMAAIHRSVEESLDSVRSAGKGPWLIVAEAGRSRIRFR